MRRFEHRKQPLASPRVFLRRILDYVALAVGIVVFSLAIGILGYHFLGGLQWIDSLLNASMILGGMGPVDTLQTNAAKLFASFYALYAGLILLVSAGVLMAPVFHRFLHHFHIELDEGSDN